MFDHLNSILENFFGKNYTNVSQFVVALLGLLISLWNFSINNKVMHDNNRLQKIALDKEIGNKSASLSYKVEYGLITQDYSGKIDSLVREIYITNIGSLGANNINVFGYSNSKKKFEFLKNIDIPIHNISEHSDILRRKLIFHETVISKESDFKYNSYLFLYIEDLTYRIKTNAFDLLNGNLKNCVPKNEFVFIFWPALDEKVIQLKDLEKIKNYILSYDFQNNSLD